MGHTQLAHLEEKMSFQEMINPLTIVLAIGCLILVCLAAWLLYKYNQVEASHQAEMDQAQREIGKAEGDKQRVLDEAEELVNIICDLVLSFHDFILESTSDLLVGFEVCWDRLPEPLKEELGEIDRWVREQQL